MISGDSLLMPVCGQPWMPASCVQGSCREIRSLSNTLSHVCSGHVQRVYVYQTDSSVDFIL